MITLFIKLLVNALAIFLVGNFIQGIHVPDYVTALWAAVLLGILNVTIRPVLKLLSLPITILTLGLFAFVVNGFTFWLAAKFINGFAVDSFWWAVIGAFIVSVISTILNRLVLGSDGKVGDIHNDNIRDI
ncbi:MAG: hypothetical protein UY04_C0011G0013 [Parcubacteria group bacterium GW2011_GWA2_47_7]|nr:MAG: hypothetical protein UY04_C0011G0013 [Parcubacteria group bacterium GW2011_GWA2_47_7]